MANQRCKHLNGVLHRNRKGYTSFQVDKGIPFHSESEDEWDGTYTFICNDCGKSFQYTNKNIPQWLEEYVEASYICSEKVTPR